MAYYFLGSYNRDDAEKALLDIGYIKKEHGKEFISYIYHSKDDAFWISLTSPTEGKIQIHGKGPENIFKKGIKSRHYSHLEKLVTILKPKRIVNDAVQDVLPKLQKISAEH